MITAIIFTYLSSFLCALANNQSMTILLTQILVNPAFNCNAVDHQDKIAALGLIIGSNYGANLLLNGSLAGIMFESILDSKKAPKITYFYFARIGVLVMAPAILVAAIISSLW